MEVMSGDWSYKTCKALVKQLPPTPNDLQAGYPSCPQTNSSRARKVESTYHGTAQPKLT